MKVELVIDPEYREPKAVFYAAEMSERLNQIVKQLTDGGAHVLLGYQQDKVFVLAQEELYRFYTDGGRVMADTKTESYGTKLRLYEAAELLPIHFVRISNAEIVNMEKVKCLDLSISGTIRIELQNGTKSFVSRRYVDKIKQYFGL